ncbi:hydroxymethylglutaryl-CoA synthase [Streptococcus pneumoniae]|uniref:hydroxymethylglutaryl-CoA synthase n=1 Tax=Streptococcus pneumoniae TaxID=1313 RepID=UPI0007699C92|nr:hydroxymethylglutaryl-CoA synthase [Streptococcus pneumoniae]MDS3275020.1 hydroxymethylglutaryl-CoA synthase [Streptococcus pneumoniae]MDS3599738.1 hydroxymethylglutaryl-CoA synthase [Streptococcus pneumoniae]MDS3870091.1 hydroxymethylglutaryl-CoA synthase [Streptococcus pneumoniae]MDS5306763.1 hydroxymethylglutaryl-CoA synthase [Streptococcus pneumoniae]MDS5314831.1 hydroxymethylglutaryl-CoA synthase [Streptococcus pneumoniae]
MTIGIDKIGFATSQYVLKLQDLAEARGIDPEKLSKGLLLKELSIAPLTEDIVTLAASASDSILTEQERQEVDMVIVATESGIDQSKAAAVFVHGLLGIQPFARSFEIKEACYGATAALHYAKLHVENSSESKVLVIASDIAKYGIETPGEPTQGAGSVAMLITQNPRMMAFNNDNVAQTRDIMDFWRPNYSTTPYVNGVYSTQQYLDSLKTTWLEYQKRYQLTLDDFAAVCFHLPYPKLALKGLKKIMDKSLPQEKKDLLQKHFDQSILYSQKVGNIYTGSLFLGLLSLLENTDSLKAGDKIALYSYGSGAVAEFFSGELVEGYEAYLDKDRLNKLNQRTALSVADYEKVFFEEVDLDETNSAQFAGYENQDFALVEILDHQRRYSKVEK